MTFPVTDRVGFKKRPLEEVICRFDFPAIFRVEESPIQFQERIRKTYPNPERRVQSPAIPAELLTILGAGNIPVFVVHNFSDESKNWTVTITKDFVALSSKEYDNWDEFQKRLYFILDAFCDIYDPDYYTRVGLRYVNVIRKQQLGLSDVPWSDLLKPFVLGEVCTAPLKEENFEYSRQDILYKLDEGDGKVLIRHGLSHESNERKDLDGQVYKIDTDFFAEEKLDRNGGYERLRRFNFEAGNLFRWYIEPSLHTALEP